MAIAVFRNKSFQVSRNKINTFNDLTWSGDLNTETQEKLNGKPSTYIKGVNLDSMSFSIQLKRILGMNVRKEIDDWEDIKLNADPGIFMLGTKPLGDNKWLLKSTSVSNTIITNKGELMEAVLQLEFEEYVRPGSSSATKKATKAKSKAKGSAVAVTIVPSNYVNASDKADKKRNNTNANKAVANGKKI